MADEQQKANVVLTADTTQYEQSMSRSAQATNTVTASLGKLLESMYKLTASAGKKLIGIGAVETAGLVAATAAAAKLQEQMAQLEASAALTGKNMGQMTQAVRTLRSDFGNSTSAAVALVTQLNSLGQASSSVEKLAVTFTRLGKVTGESVSGLTDGLITLQRQMGTTGAEATNHFAAGLATLSQTAGVSAQSILNFSNSIAPLGRLAGISQTQIMGISTAFAKAGADGFAAANTFSGMLSTITEAVQTGSPLLSSYANLVGKTVEQFKSMNRTEAITQIFEAINKQGPAAITTLNQLGFDGIRATKSIQALVQSGDLRSSVKTAVEGNQDTKKFEEAADNASKTLSHSLSKLSEQLKQTGEAIGQGLVGPATVAVNVLSAMAGAINAILQPLGNIPGLAAAAGAALTVMGGIALRMFGVFSGAAALQMVRRGWIGQGFRARDPQAMGSVDYDRARVNAPVGDPNRANMIQRGMWQVGNTAGNIMNAAGVGPGGQPLWRRALQVGQAAGSMAISGTGWLARSQLEPLYPSRMLDPHSGARMIGPDIAPATPMARLARWTEGSMPGTGNVAASGRAFGDSLKALVTSTGEVTEETKKHGSALRAAGRELGSFAGGLGKAAAGLGGAGLWGGTKAIGRGIGSLAGQIGPLGAGMMAGGFIISKEMDRRKELDEFRQDTSDKGASSKYAAALGEAGDATKTFADVVKAQAEKVASAGSGLQSVSGNLNITAEDVKTGQGKEYTDPRMGGMSRTETVAFASAALQNATPERAKAVALDVAKKYGQEEGNRILQEAQQTAPNMAAFWQGGFQKNSTLSLPALPGMNLNMSAFPNTQAARDSLDLAQGQWTRSMANAPTEDLRNRAGVVGVTGGLQAALQADNQAGVELISTTLAKGLGSTSKESADAIQKAVQTLRNPTWAHPGGEDPYASGPAKVEEFLDTLSKSSDAAMAAQATVMKNWIRANPGVDIEQMMNMPGQIGQEFLGGISPAVKGRLRGTGVGAAMLQGRSAIDLNTVLNNQGNPGAMNDAVNAMVANTTKLNASYNEQVQALMDFKQAVGDANDPLYKLADAAQNLISSMQGAFQRIRGYTQGQVVAENTQGFTAAGQRIAGGDKSQGAIDAFKGATLTHMQDQAAARDYYAGIVKAKGEFDIQMSRGDYQYNLQRQQSNEDFFRQLNYGQDDYDRSRRLQEDSFNRSRARAERDFIISREEQMYGYNLQRTRAEKDFNHQVEVMAKESAKNVYDAYSRVQVERTSSAQNLLGNLADQQRRMDQQQQNLQQLRQAGLSSDAISTLGLNDPNKQQQVARMADEMLNNPAMIKAFNDSIVNRMDAAKKIVTDQDSTAWIEMNRSFKQNMDRGAEDTAHSLSTQLANFKRGMDDQRTEQKIQTDISIEEHNRQQARMIQNFQRGMDRMAVQHKLSMDQAREDFSRAYEQITGDLNQVADKAISSLTGTAQKQAQALRDALGPVVTDIVSMLALLGIDVTQNMTPQQRGAYNKYAAMDKERGEGGMAEGGPIVGFSPHKKADNIPIRATAGEFMQPVDTVNYYGVDFMEKVRNRELPRYAAGGMINPVNASHSGWGSYPGHTGLDFRAGMGTPVMAALAGTANQVNHWGYSYGNHVRMGHPGNIETIYAHLSQTMATVGQQLAQGNVLGLSGSTGNSTGPHLHFEVRVNGRAVDPTPYLTGTQMVPVGGLVTSPIGAAGANVDLKERLRSIPSVQRMNQALSAIAPYNKLIPQNWITDKIADKYQSQVNSMMLQGVRIPSPAGSNPAAAGSELERFILAIVKQETGGEKDPYKSRWGKYAMSPQYINGYAMKYLGRPMSAAEYLGSPANQDLLGRAALTGLFNQYGAKGAASSWYSGNPTLYNSTRPQPGGPSIASYVNSVLKYMGYDEGGILGTGTTAMQNNTGKPEAVLTNEQWNAIASLAASGIEAQSTLVRGSSVPSRASTTNYYSRVDKSTNFTGPITVMANDPAELERTLMDKKRLLALTGR